MNEQRKLGGCLGVILLIALVLGIALMGRDKEPDNPTLPPSPGIGLDTTESPLIDPELQPGYPDLDFPLTADPTAPTDPFADTLYYISMQDGFYRVNTLYQEAVPLGGELQHLGSCESSWAGPGTVGSCPMPPIILDRYSGDSILITENQWNSLPPDQKTGMTVTVYPAVLLGYGNRLLCDTVAVTDLETVEGIPVSEVNQDPEAINAALLGSGFKSLHCKNGNEDFCHLLADSYERSMYYSCLESGHSVTHSVIMTNPYISYREDAPIAVPVQVTEDGYYIIDLSSLASGSYVLNGVVGSYAVTLI